MRRGRRRGGGGQAVGGASWLLIFGYRVKAHWPFAGDYPPFLSRFQAPHEDAILVVSCGPGKIRSHAIVSMDKKDKWRQASSEDAEQSRKWPCSVQSSSGIEACMSQTSSTPCVSDCFWNASVPLGFPSPVVKCIKRAHYTSCGRTVYPHVR